MPRRVRVRKNVTTSPHGNNGNNDPSTPGKTKPQTRKVLQPVILKTPTGKIQKGNYQVLHKRQVNKTALKRMCDEDDSNESPSKYQKAEKIIMEKSSILQELDDLRELDVEVSPLPPSPLPNIEDMELGENDTMTENNQGEFEVYESRNSKNKRLQKERRQLELEAEAVEQDLLRQLPGNQQEHVLRLLTGTRLESLEKMSVNSPKATLEKSTIIPIVAEGIEAKALSDIMDQAGIQVEDKRNTRRGHLLVFPKRQEDRNKLAKIKLPVGQVREPKQRVNYKEQDKRTLVMVGIPLHVENTTVEQDRKKNTTSI